MKRTAALGLVLILTSYGCATAHKMKTVPEEKLYFSYYADQDKKQACRQEMVLRHAEWPEEIRKTVLNGEIIPGMTQDQVISSYGKPLEILQTTKGEPQDHALWIYPRAYLIFQKNKLVSSEEIIKIEMKTSLVEKVRYGL